MESKCPGCGARVHSLDGREWSCGTFMYSDRLHRSQLCEAWEQLRAKDREIEQLRAEVERMRKAMREAIDHYPSAVRQETYSLIEEIHSLITKEPDHA